MSAWFLLTRLVVFAALWLAARHGDRTLPQVLTVFDGAYYRDIADHGYPGSLPAGPNGVGRSSVAFFPLFPLLAAGLGALGLSFAMAAALLTTLCGLVATLAIYAICCTYVDRRVAFVVAMLWSVQPLGFVLSLTYSEALYSALATTCLLLLLRGRWLLAGAAAAAAGATRPSGLVLALCLGVALLAAWRRLATADRVQGLLALAVAPLGFVGYQLYLWRHTGRADAWFVTEREGWGVYTDGGVETARRFATYLLHPAQRPAATAVAVVLFAVAIGLVLMIRDGAPAPVLAFAVLTVVLAVTTRNAYSSIPRFVLPAVFVLLVPVVLRLTRVTERIGRPAPGGGSNLATRLTTAALAVAALSVMAAAGAYTTVSSHYPP